MSFQGNKKGSIKLKRFGAGLSRNIKIGMKRAGMIMERALKQRLRGVNPVKLKKSPHSELRSRTSTLRNSLRFRLVNGGNGVIISPFDIEYAAIHEYGGWAGKDHKTWIPKRPWFFPTVEDKTDDIVKGFGNAIYKPLRK